MKFIGLLPRHIKSVLMPMLVASTCAFVPMRTRAEMPPSAYIAFQRDASEELDVEIISVQQSKSETKEFSITTVVLEAKVLKAKRTATQLKPEATITIKYDHRESKIPGWVGPSETPILGKGEKYPAYLKKMGDKPVVYQPAAGGYTFKTVRE